MTDELYQKGFILGSTAKGNPIEECLKDLEQQGYKVLRADIVTSRNNVAGKEIKYAVMGTFDHHTDGCFFPTPPRYIAIEVIETQGGGALSLLDLSDMPYSDLDLKTEYMFGTNGNYIKAPLRSASTEPPIYRYRQDYMSPQSQSDQEQLNGLHEKIREFSVKKEISLGELQPGEYVVIDNWRMLHGRKDFIGERTIKRYWIGA